MNANPQMLIARRETFTTISENKGLELCLEAYFGGPLDQNAMLINLREAKELLQKAVAPFRSEPLPDELNDRQKLAAHFYQELNSLLSDRDVEVVKLRLFEGGDFWIDYGRI